MTTDSQPSAQFSYDRRTWGEATEIGAPVNCYVHIEGCGTIGEIVEWFAEHHPGVDAMGVTLCHTASARWTEPATADDVALRDARALANRERTEKWERETLARLTEKYGSNTTERGVR